MDRNGPDPAGTAAESSLMEHLLELRTRLLRALAGLVAVLLVLLPFANKLYAWLAAPLLDKLPTGGQLIAVQNVRAREQGHKNSRRRDGQQRFEHHAMVEPFPRDA